MKFPLYWVDAFTPRVFAGNPAAVVPLTGWPPDRIMQQIACENGLAETAFFVRTGPDRFHLRWFTPELEIDLCGHATLASAFVIFTQLGQVGERIVFDTQSGPLPVTRLSDARLELDFPARPAVPVLAADVPPALRPGLGVTPIWIGKSRDYLCVYPTADAVLALKPDFKALNQIDVIGIIATAPDGPGGVDFVSRFFSPNCVVPEDPVTGSAHCTLVPYWAAQLGKTRLQARQVSPRGGELLCTLAGDRVKIAGHATLYLRGDIIL